MLINNKYLCDLLKLLLFEFYIKTSFQKTKFKMAAKEIKRIQQSFTNTLSWILSEIQDNQDDCISIICKVPLEFLLSFHHLSILIKLYVFLLKIILTFFLG